MADDDPLLDPDYRYSIIRLTGNGTRTVWDLNFAGGFINRSHVKAYLEFANGARTELSFTFITDTSVSVTPAVASGQIFAFYRQTPKASPLVDFSAGSALTERNLDTLAKQAVFSSAETLDLFAETGIKSDLAISVANEALEATSATAALADAAIAASDSATATATAAQELAEDTASGFDALAATVGDLLGADLSGLARLDTAQSFVEPQQFRAGLEARTLDGTIGVQILPAGKYRLFSGGVYGPERDFGDWVTLSNKPSTFAPAPHTQDWSTITGAPSTFPPSAHTHPWGSITDKPSTFPPATHGHAWADLTVPATIRNIIVSTAAPTGGSDGDVWLRYVP
jgi:hypothetical protein